MQRDVEKNVPLAQYVETLRREIRATARNGNLERRALSRSTLQQRLSATVPCTLIAVAHAVEPIVTSDRTVVTVHLDAADLH